MSDQDTGATVGDAKTAIDKAINELVHTRLAGEKGPGRWLRSDLSGQNTMIMSPGRQGLWPSTISNTSQVPLKTLTHREQELIRSLANSCSGMSSVAGEGGIGDGAVRGSWLSKYRSYDPETEMDAETQESVFVTEVAKQWVRVCGQPNEGGNG